MNIYELINNSRKIIFDYKKEMSEFAIMGNCKSEISQEVQTCLNALRSAIINGAKNIKDKKEREQIANRIIERGYEEDEDSLRDSINKQIDLDILYKIYINLMYYFLNETQQIRKSYLKCYNEVKDGICLM